jgi:AbrB family looped-hinge helix DNA binding protein
MGVQIKVSDKGQCVIPDGMRQRWNIKPGDQLEAIETPEGILLRPVADPIEAAFGPRLRSWDEVGRGLPRYDGPSITDEMIERAILDEAADRFVRKTAR